MKPGRPEGAPNDAGHDDWAAAAFAATVDFTVESSIENGEAPIPIADAPPQSVAAMQWYEAEVCELIARLAANPVPAPAIMYGSSSITLWATIAEDLRNPRAVNAGFGGSTLEACAYFFERIVPPLEPAALLVYAGDNDLGDGRSAEQVLASFRQLAAKVDRYCGPIPFGFMSIKPSPSRSGILDRIRRANDLIRTEIERRPDGFYVPVFDAMLENGKPRPELFLPDGLHLGSAGYALWTQLLEPFRSRMFANR